MSGGAKEDRTPDLVDANDALSQLSYGPTAALSLSNCVHVAKQGLDVHRYELPTPACWSLMQPYRPISCDLHDHLEIACMHGRLLCVELNDGTSVEGRAITTISTPQKEEFLEVHTAGGRRDLRLDTLKAITTLDGEDAGSRVVLQPDTP